MLKEEKTNISPQRMIWFMYGLFILGTLICSYLLPYGNDDWQWGSAKRIKLLKRGFAGYNGRYLGNLLALAESRSHLWKAIIITVIMIALLLMLVSLLGQKTSVFCVSICILAVICIPRAIFRQTLGWAPGFVNFVPPLVLLFVYLRMTQWIWENQNQKTDTFRYAAAVFAIGICSKLFAEHNTLLNLFYATVFPIWTLLRDKKAYRVQAGWFAGCAAGAVVMFSNSAYTKALHTDSDFKAIRFTSEFLKKQLRDQILPFIYVENWVLNTFIAVCLSVLLIKTMKGLRRYFYCAMLIMLSGVSVIHRLQIIRHFNGKAMLVLTCLWYLAVIGAMADCMMCGLKDPNAGNGMKERRHQYCLWDEILMLFILSAVSVIPLVAVTPIGSRCFYTHYMLQTGSALLLLRKVLDPAKKRMISVHRKQFVLAITMGAVLLAGSCYCSRFIRNGIVRIRRDTLIREAIAREADTLVLPRYPYPEIIWLTDPFNENTEKLFRRFFGIPRKTKLVFADEQT